MIPCVCRDAVSEIEKIEKCKLVDLSKFCRIDEKYGSFAHGPTHVDHTHVMTERSKIVIGQGKCRGREHHVLSPLLNETRSQLG